MQTTLELIEEKFALELIGDGQSFSIEFVGSEQDISVEFIGENQDVSVEFVEERVGFLEFTAQGPTGPPGIAGHTPTEEEIAAIIGDVILDAVDANYVHNQFVASAIWTVDHNLNKYPSIQAMDSAGGEVYGSVEYTSVNQLIITFSAPMGGKVTCN